MRKRQNERTGGKLRIRHAPWSHTALERNLRLQRLEELRRNIETRR